LLKHATEPKKDTHRPFGVMGVNGNDYTGCCSNNSNNKKKKSNNRKKQKYDNNATAGRWGEGGGPPGAGISPC
jgi:hypothetical protein